MVSYDIQLKGFNKLDAASQRLILPLQTAAVQLAEAIKTRVRNGVSPTGGQWTPLGNYSTTGRSRDDNNRWWVAPGQPQPAGFERRVSSGQWQGWVVYENYARYLDLLPNGKRRDWDKTGRLWASLGVRAMAVNKVKISFYGSRGRGSAQAQVAYLAGLNEPVSVLQYNEPERAAIAASIMANINEEFAKRIGEAVEAGNVARRQRLAARRSSRLLGV